MTEPPAPATESREEQIARAIDQLMGARERLHALTGGQVDAIVDPAGGGSILLRQAQEALIESRAHYRRLLKQMLMSGYTDTAIVENGVLEPGTAFIQKPFSPAALASKIRDVLDGPAGGTA